jgi:putative membrane protein
LPSRQILIIELFLLGGIIGAIVYTIEPKPQGTLFGLGDGLFAIAFGSLISTFVIHKIAGNGILTFKRAIALADVGIALLAIGFLSSSLAARWLNNPSIFASMYFISCGITVAFCYIILAISSSLNQIKLFFLSLLQPLLILIFHSSLILIISTYSYITYGIYFLSFFTVAILSYVFARWFYTSIERVGNDLLGYSSLLLFKAFLDAFILDKTGLLEMLLKVLAIKDDVEVRTLSFYSKSQRGTLVAPLIHPGPFGDLGSSKMPTKIADKFLSQQIFPVVFHTPTTHDRDLILSKDCERVIQSVENAPKGTEKYASPIVVKKKGSITVNCQIFGNIPFVVITRSPQPTEDLPDYINEMCMKKILESGYPDGIVVDAHNVMDLIYTELSPQDKVDLIDAITEALTEAKREGEGILKVGFANSKINGYSTKEGIGDGGIMILITEVNQRKGVYIAVDANNMVVGLREKVQEMLRKVGFDYSEITTTDTHIVTGRTSREAYFPLGKAIPEGILLEKIFNAVKEADSKITECSVNFSKRRISDVFILGNKGIENLWKVTDKTIKVAKQRVVALIFLLIISGVTVYLISSAF